MAVHKRVYRPLSGGDLTAAWSRFLVMPRYALEALRGERLLTGYLVLCLVPALAAALVIYVYNNPLAQTLIGLSGDPSGWLLQMNGEFFYWLLVIQGSMTLLLTAWVGPGLVAPDLVNNGLALYLSRPFSKAEYVLGRLSTLFLLLSAVTWIPDLLLFALQAGLADGWGRENLGVAGAIVIGSWIWIALVSVLVLAVSAWVKWRMVATGLFFALFFVSAGLGATMNTAMRTHWGNLFSLEYVVRIIWRELFDIAVIKRHRRFDWKNLTPDVPVGYCWLALGVMVTLALLLLWKRLTAREVVRG